eukprot:CAMPEP_0168829650 /NCGR_PEP_ID=MMETSP0727-20121128/1128_1 /TAXON_ID=265536 /ORGANISM="Amphiprora sp., Strain CCMP467" /LENGTH=163 /DNA_ID=CAMNT_0008882863 /DNA_START=480 /DNA_END=971 /DNA_ORIENTATION=+
MAVKVHSLAVVDHFIAILASFIVLVVSVGFLFPIAIQDHLAWYIWKFVIETTLWLRQFGFLQQLETEAAGAASLRDQFVSPLQSVGGQTWSWCCCCIDIIVLPSTECLDHVLERPSQNGMTGGASEKSGLKQEFGYLLAFVAAVRIVTVVFGMNVQVSLSPQK